jgi:hypothetical protein
LIDRTRVATMLAMKQHVLLAVASVLSVLFLTFHLADDIVRGFEQGGLSNLALIPIVAGWLYAALILAERRSGYVINLLFSLLALGVPVIHMSGRGVGAGSRIANSNGAFFFVWTLLALSLTALFSVILSAHGLWKQRARSR